MAPIAFMTPAGPEWIVLAVFALLVLGPKRLPDFARSLGKGMSEMRASFADATNFDSDDEPDPDLVDPTDEDLPDYPDEDETEDEDPARAPETGSAPQATSRPPSGLPEAG